MLLVQFLTQQYQTLRYKCFITTFLLFSSFSEKYIRLGAPDPQRFINEKFLKEIYLDRKHVTDKRVVEEGGANKLFNVQICSYKKNVS